jgi:OOP family OmpA-OmpF porin
MKFRNFKPAVATALVALGLGAVSAHAAGAYAGAGLGSPDYRGGDVNGITGNGSGVSEQVYGGYQFTPNFALEAGIANLGHIDNSNGTVNSHGEYFDVVGFLPLQDNWSLLGSIGMARVNLDTSNGDSRGNGLKLGLGAEYALNRNISLRGEVERYEPKEFGSTRAINQPTVGLHIGF